MGIRGGKGSNGELHYSNFKNVGQFLPISQAVLLVANRCMDFGIHQFDIPSNWGLRLNMGVKCEL